MGVSLPPFQKLLDEYRTDVYRFLVATVGPGEADDCFQETFLSALKAYPRLRNANNLKGWLLTIAHRKALDAHRSAKRRPHTVAEVPDRASPVEPMDPVWEMVKSLPRKQMSAVLYRFAGDLSYRQIAVAMEISEEAARQNVSQGLRTLRRRES